MSDKKVTLEEFEKFKKELNKNNKKYITDWIVVLIISIFLIWALLLNYFFLKDLKENYFISSKNTIITEWDSEVFAKRFENLELKYIDIVASKESINFWFTILSILAPFIIWYSLYERGKMKRDMEKEINDLNNKIESTEIKLKNTLENIEKKSKEAVSDIVEQWNIQMKINTLLIKWDIYLKDWEIEIEKWKYSNALISFENCINTFNKISKYSNNKVFKDLKINVIEIIETYKKEIKILKELNFNYKEILKNWLKILKIEPNNVNTILSILKSYNYLKDKDNFLIYLLKLKNTDFFENVEYRNNFYKNIDKDFNNFNKDKDFIEFVEDLKKKYWDE